MINKENIVSVEKKYDLQNRHNTYKVIFNVDKVCFVPNNQANTDYQEIQEWAAIEGNNITDPGA
tara:strand:+ start:360 stop:551 length:192 start_codon:yes stop_codon:yes gene_type:complete